MVSARHSKYENVLTGEVSGAFLLGIVASCYDFNLIRDSDLPFALEEIAPTGWYPYGYLIETIEIIETSVTVSESILFQAGMNFLRIWYEEGPGKKMIFSTLDWLHANDESGGYNSVIRGGAADEIGWCKTLQMDETNGIAVIENVNPLIKDYLKGVFYGGCRIFDDVAYVSVDVDTQPYPKNPHFRRSLITVRFRLNVKPRKIVYLLFEQLRAFRLPILQRLNRRDVS